MKNNDDLSWLFGIEKYFQYTRETDKKKFIRNIINLKYSNEKDKPWVLVNLINDEYTLFSKTNLAERDNRIGFYTRVCTTDSMNSLELIKHAMEIWPDCDIFPNLEKLYHHGSFFLTTVFSKGQVSSKIWLSEILNKFSHTYKNIVLIGGWMTHHSLYLKDITYEKLYSVDPDENINDLARSFNPTVYISNNDVIDIIDHDGSFNFNGDMIVPDLVINTSAEHMSSDWLDMIKPETSVLIQSNDHDIKEHVNYCLHLRDFLEKYKLTKILYRGELQLPKFKRFCIFGKK